MTVALAAVTVLAARMVAGAQELRAHEFAKADYWSPGTLNLFSIGRTSGSDLPWKFDILSTRWRYFSVGAISGFKGGDSTYVGAVFPVGLSYPVSARRNYYAGADATFYWGAGLVELAFRAQSKYVASLAAGYRHQYGGRRLDDLGNPIHIGGVFIEVSAGLTATSIRRRVVKQSRVVTANEAAQLDAEMRAARGGNVVVRFAYDDPGTLVAAAIRGKSSERAIVTREDKRLFETAVRDAIRQNGFTIVERRSDANGIVEVELIPGEAMYRPVLGPPGARVWPRNMTWRLLWMSATTGVVLYDRHFTQGFPMTLSSVDQLSNESLSAIRRAIAGALRPNP
jgi:hypothetical protein